MEASKCYLPALHRLNFDKFSDRQEWRTRHFMRARNREKNVFHLGEAKNVSSNTLIALLIASVYAIIANLRLQWTHSQLPRQPELYVSSSTIV